MGRLVRSWVATLTVVLTAQILTPVATADPGATAHRVYVAVITDHGEFPMSAGEMDLAIDAALQDVAEDLPNVFSSFTRVETRYVDSPATPTGGAMCGLWAPDALITETAPPGTEEAMEAEGRALFGLPPRSPGAHVVYVLPPRCAANAIGFAMLGADVHAGGFVVVSAGWAAGLRGVLVHELGHNFSLLHADATCVYQGASCGVIEYADCYAPVGGNFGSVFSTAERVILGAVQPGEVQTVDAGGGAFEAQIRLAPRSAPSGLRGIAVTDPSSGEVTYLDYRSGTGLDADAEYLGVSFCPTGVTATRIRGRGTLLLRRDGPNGSTGAAVAGETIQIGAYASATVLGADGDGGALVAVRVAPLPPFDRLPRVGVEHLNGRWVRAELTGRFSPDPDGPLRYTWYVEDATGSHPLTSASPSGPGDATRVPPGATRVWVEVAAEKRGRLRGVVTSRPVSMTEGAGLQVRLSGKAQVGRTLSVRVPRGLEGPVRYRWFADRRRIDGADRRRLRLTPDLVGTRIQAVVITGRGADRERTVCRAKGRVEARGRGGKRWYPR
ncbi:hypothetical protein [Nocardioides flavescens]|uniref:Metallo-peptidase family M12B Reprolysin-like n=1 Tax=Nocardioides flavescens TaxID=2691959 RepID=A0A6L7F3M6_9ACTN|nr:hypothetical protein [Nocardioides flavescens]MXG91840.1 hypothetical protein [Nocardioides flavescens]